MSHGELSPVVSRFFDGLESWLAQWSVRSPRRAIRAAGAVGWLRNALSRRWPAPAEVAAVLGRGRRESARLSRAIAADAARNRLCVRLGDPDWPDRPDGPVGIDALRPLGCWRDGAPRDLTPPAILAVFHLGAHQALALGLADLALPVLIVRWTPLPTGGGERVEVVSTHGGLEIRSAALKRSLDTLRSGGVVLSALDGADGSRVRARCLGREIALGAGVFHLASRCGVPIVPYTAAWERGRALFEIHEPLARPPAGEDFATAQAQIAADWLGRYLERRPDQLSLGLLRTLLSS